MVKKTVTYEDFNGVERTEDLYFNLNELELTKFAAELPDEFTDSLNGNENVTNMDKAEAVAVKFAEKLGTSGIIDFIEKLILKAYGVKSEDGRRFNKNEKITNEFEYSGAYPALVMDLLTNNEAAADFVNKLIPAKLAAKLSNTNGSNITQLPSSNNN